LARLFKKAPLYARNSDYIEKYVNDSTEYIVFDHHNFEMELMKSGMDSISLWNVLRLTPDVYRAVQNNSWIIKNELVKFEKEGIRDRAEYVLDTTINLIVSADQTLAMHRTPGSRFYSIQLRKDNVPVYKKADAGSEVIKTTPPGLRNLNVDFSIPAMNGSGNFWHTMHLHEDDIIRGYVSEDFVEGVIEYPGPPPYD